MQQQTAPRPQKEQAQQKNCRRNEGALHVIGIYVPPEPPQKGQKRQSAPQPEFRAHGPARALVHKKDGAQKDPLHQKDDKRIEPCQHRQAARQYVHSRQRQRMKSARERRRKQGQGKRFKGTHGEIEQNHPRKHCKVDERRLISVSEPQPHCILSRRAFSASYHIAGEK